MQWQWHFRTAFGTRFQGGTRQTPEHSPGSRGRFSGKHLVVGFLSVCVALAGGCDSSFSGQPPAGSAEPPPVVKLAPVEQAALDRVVSVSGSLVAMDDAVLSVKVPGRLKSIHVDLGDLVHEGDVVAEVEPTDYQLRVQQAAALLAQARTQLGLLADGDDDRVDLEKTSKVKQARAVREEALKSRERIDKLASEGIISQSELESAEAAFEVADNSYQDALEEARRRQAQLVQRRAELAIARQQLHDTVLKAPFDGAVRERRAAQGEYLAEGAAVLTVVRMDPLRLRVEVPEREAPLVKNGQPVRLTLEGDTNVYRGEITRLSPVINESNRMLVVEARVPNPGGLRPGSFARAEIVVHPQEKALVVPADAVSIFAGLEKVYVVKAGRVEETRVLTGRHQGDLVEVLSGLTGGEKVVLQPGNLQDGQLVKTE